MKALFFVLAACAAAGVVGARADLTIVQKVEGVGQSMETTTRYKDGLTRLDVNPGGVSILVNSKTGETINLQHAQKSYLRTPNAVVTAAVDSMKAQGGGDAAKSPGGHPQLTPTGRKETVAGYAAEEYSYSAGTGKITLWLTHDIPDYAQVMKELAAAYSHGPLAAMTQSVFVDLAHLPGFPVRVVNEIQPGTALTSTVTAVNVKPLDAAELAVPADYTEIKAPVMLTPPAASSLPSPKAQ